MSTHRCRRRDRGAADALALVLLAPASVGLALLVVALGRQVDARAQVRTAAESAAQAAALERSPAAARVAVERVVAAMLTDPDTCSDPTVAVDTSAFAPGGSVVVTVTCRVSDRGVEPVGAGRPVLAATATATIDPLRAAGSVP